MVDLDSVLWAGGLALPDLTDAVLGIDVTGSDPVLATAFPIGEAAAAALAGGGAAAARLHRLRGGEPQSVAVDVEAAAVSLLGFLYQSQPTGGEPVRLDRLNPPTTNFFQCGDGRWIHLHGGFSHLSDGILELLGCAADHEAIAAAVGSWKAADLEDALAERHLCGAMLRSPQEWAAHPQGSALGALAAVEIDRIGDAPPHGWPPGGRPLSGIRVLDLTRVLAGPASGRTLASYGAEVLRVAAPHLPSIQPFVVETGHGKRSAFLDLRDRDQVRQLRELARGADVFTDGYRNGSLARHGFGAESLAELRPGIVVVSISCYGDVGPWAERAGWEQLAQTTSGLAHLHSGDDPPSLVPAAATDYTTGYLAAWGAMEALHRRATEGGSWRVRVSLCQTAQWLLHLGTRCDPTAPLGAGDVSHLQTTSETPYGELRHLAPAVRLSATPPRWEQPTVPLGHDAPEWRPHPSPSVIELRVDGVRSLVRSCVPEGRHAPTEAVVLVHGNPGSSEDWNLLLPQIGQFARAIAPDMPGYGKADRPTDFDYTVTGYANHLTGLIEQLGVERVHLVLHDFGGVWGLQFASEHPERVASLTLFDIGILPGYRWHRYARIWRTPVVGEIFQLGATRTLTRLAQNADNPKPLPREFTDRMFDDSDRAMKRGVLALYRSTPDLGALTEGLGMRLAPLRLPTLVIWGDGDKYLPVTYAEDQQRFFDADVHIVPNCGHWPMIDEPETVSRLVLPFLRAQVRPDAPATERPRS